MDNVYETVISQILNRSERCYSSNPTTAAREVVADVMMLKAFIDGGTGPRGGARATYAQDDEHEYLSTRNRITEDVTDILWYEARDRLFDLERYFTAAFDSAPDFEIQVWSALRLPLREVKSKFGEVTYQEHTTTSLASEVRCGRETLRKIGLKMDMRLYDVLCRNDEVSEIVP